MQRSRNQKQNSHVLTRNMKIRQLIRILNHYPADTLVDFQTPLDSGHYDIKHAYYYLFPQEVVDDEGHFRLEYFPVLTLK
jgi:hypothetical protein